MRRLIAVSAFGLLLAVPVWAQRGGGGHAGFGGGHAGGFGGHAAFSGHGFSGSHVGGGHSSGGHLSARRFSGGPSFSRGGTRFSRTGSRFHDPIRERLHFRNNCFGWNCRGFGFYPWGWGYYDPFLWGWWDHNSNNYDQDYEQERYVDQLNAENIELQRMLRQEEADRDDDAYAQRSYHGPQASSEPKEPVQAEPAAPTVLVFRDQHKQEISNYAIVGQTLWAFVPQHNQRIPLADLDIPATVKANDDRGVTFRVPAS